MIVVPFIKNLVIGIRWLEQNQGMKNENNDNLKFSLSFFLIISALQCELQEYLYSSTNIFRKKWHVNNLREMVPSSIDFLHLMV